MATNMFKKYTESLVREHEVGANVPGGSAVIIGTQPGVTLAASGGSTNTKTTNLPGDITSVTYGNAGVGFRTNAATVAFDGSWLFPVATVTNGETVPNSGAGTDAGTKVYAIIASGKVTGLTLVSTSNTYFGVIDDGNIVGGIAPVKIGVPA